MKMKRFAAIASAIGAIGAAAAPADAAVTIGQTFTPDVSFTGSGVFIQAGAPNGSYRVPSDGVITSWSFQAPANPTPPIKLKMFRPAGGPFGTDYTTVGDSELATPTTGVLNTFMTRIPVKANDVPGHFYSNTTRSWRFAAAAYYTVCCSSGGDPPPGTTENYVPSGDEMQIDLSAVLEPDANRNGFGDETQECGGKPATVIGTNAADKLSGTPGADVIAAGGGNDKASGLAGHDLICGGSGKDTLNGGAGKDTLLGQKGKDVLKGGGNSPQFGFGDNCKGGKGNDTAKGCEKMESI
jgi:RTX calcium-binding nonapeptide repeat (4 copies)